ncbi:paraquat-inducible protein A [Paracoccus jiaweipingae]|uniref:paraquat-inducible protein A n=1 Tax=unclassified Paracoccus (in: a-proteobacteria) TaxID=2688777 RepID=UPI00378A3BF8
MIHQGDYNMTTGAGLIACPRCDALHLETELTAGETARCIRCGTVLARPRAGAFSQIVALSFAQMVLMFGAVFFPFLKISRMGFEHGTSLFGVALAYSHGLMLPLTVALMAMIVGLPVLRAGLLVYVLAPMARGGRPAPLAGQAFRLSEQLRPWSMAEIFVIGTAVALIKIGGLAHISLGPAFWAICALILVGGASHVFFCATTIWDAIEDGGGTTDGREMADTPLPPDAPVPARDLSPAAPRDGQP